MNKSSFACNCKLSTSDRQGILYYICGNVVVPIEKARPRTESITSITMHEIIKIALFMRDYWKLRLSYKTIVKLIIDASF